MEEAAVLLVDDEPALLLMLDMVLKKEGFRRIDHAESAAAALARCRQKRYDIILLDVMLPDKSGFEICPFIRETTDAPILFVTAKGSDLDKLTGFAMGGDDYITKPFNPLEVVARMKAQLRRSRPQAEEPGKSARTNALVYDYGRFQVDELAGELRVEGKPVACPAQVFQLLLFLCKHPNRIFTKDQLYEAVWGIDSMGDDHTVIVHIRRIRERIERAPGQPDYLVTVRGLGYKLVPPKELP